MAGSAVNLTGLLGGMGRDISRPTQLSQGQQGLFTGLRSSLAPMPEVTPEDPVSLRAAASEALRRGDTQRATQYANMAQQVERAQLVKREEGRIERSRRDQLQEVEPLAASRKNQFLAQQAQISRAGNALEKFVDTDLMESIRIGELSPQQAILEQRERMKEEGTSKRNTEDNIAAMERQLVSSGYTLEAARIRAKATAAADKSKSVSETFKRIDGDPRVDQARMNEARDAYETLANLEGQAGSSVVVQRALTALFPNDVKAQKELERFSSAKSLPRRIRDTLKMWFQGELSDPTIEEYQQIAKVIYDFEREQYIDGVEKGIKAGQLGEEDAQRVREFYENPEEIAPEDGWGIVE